MNNPPPQIEGEEVIAIEAAREAIEESAFPDNAHTVGAAHAEKQQRPLKRLRALDTEAAAKDGMERVLEVRRNSRATFSIAKQGG